VPGAAAAGPLLPPSTLNNRVVPAGEEEDPEAKEVAEACNSAGVQTGFLFIAGKEKEILDGYNTSMRGRHEGFRAERRVWS